MDAIRYIRQRIEFPLNGRNQRYFRRINSVSYIVLVLAVTSAEHHAKLYILGNSGTIAWEQWYSFHFAHPRVVRQV
jgi:hypothetical protein